MELQKLRNIGVVAHIDAGKTTVSERILFLSGAERRFGQVDEGTTVLDWMPEERERGITITAAATRFRWGDAQIQLIDTPGHVDFTIEVERCMRVLDGAILVIDAVAGVQAQSETVWRQMRTHGVPAVAFVNKCDRAGADVLSAVQTLVDRLGAPAMAIQYPLHEEGVLCGAVDLLSRQSFRYGAEGRGVEVVGECPEEIMDEVEVLRADLVEFLGDHDDSILSAMVDGREPELGELRAAVRRCTLSRALVPVLCGAALKNIGVQRLLNAVVDFLPSPLDLPPVEGELPGGGRVVRRADPSEPLCALAFKLHADAHGDLTFVRIYSGTLEVGQSLENPRRGKVERVARVVRVHADARESVESAGPGEIVGLLGLKHTGTGDTLTERGGALLLEPLGFPEPVISMVLEPESGAEREKLETALARLAHEDPSLRVREDEDTGQWTVAGMGELHLEVALHRLEGEFHVKAHRGSPRVAYRESPAAEARAEATVDRVIGGKEAFGGVRLVVRPEPGHGPAGVLWSAGAEIPEAFRAGITDSIESSAQVGPRFGYPLIGCCVEVLGGATNPRKDAELAFQQAAAIALRDALAEARVRLLEPVMAFEIESPSEFTSGIIADLNGRRAEVADLEVLGNLRVLRGTVPLAQMFGYSTAVRSLSQGRAGYTMVPAGFVEVPEAELEARGLVWL